MDETWESIEGFLWAVGRVSGRLGREGGGMVPGEEGGDAAPVDGRAGADTLRSCAYEDGFPKGAALLKGAEGGVEGLAEGWMGVWTGAADGRYSSSASRASNFSRGERGPSS